MTLPYAILILGFIGGLYMAWNIGANDVSNAMASAVGAKAITIKQAIFIASILNIIGAVFLGAAVTNTIRSGIVVPEVMADTNTAMIGALSALVGAAVWISFATWRKLPVSTTHSIVGAMVGFGLMAGGFSAVNWGGLTAVVVSWIVSPLFCMVIAFLLFRVVMVFILTRPNPFASAMRVAPVLVFGALLIICLAFVFKVPFGKSLQLSFTQAVLIGACIALVFTVIIKLVLTRLFKTKYKDKKSVEQLFKGLQIGTSCYVALSQGASDVSNAIGPLVVIYFLATTSSVGAQVPVPVWMLMFGGVGIALGIWMAGHRVMETLGTNITTLTNSRGFVVDVASASTVLIASGLGLPVSTTHATVGGIIGVGLGGGIAAVNFNVVFKIMLYWVLTVPAAAVSSIIVFNLIKLGISLF